MSARKRHPVAPRPERFLEAHAHNAAEQCCDFGISYLRIRNDYHGIPRGAVLAAGRVIPDYPHIARVFALAAGIRQSFSEPFQVEEKVDGYNVRIFRVADRCVAITRSGRICPFTTDRLPDLLEIAELERLLTEHPELVLCAEVAGPGNPYMDAASPRGGDDVALFVFDLLRQGQEQFVPLAERDALLARYGLPVPRGFGRFTVSQVAEVFEIVRHLDAEGGEGIVLKSTLRDRRVKYVCPSINVEDVATEAALELELPAEFYIHRVVRMVVALRELDQRERLRTLGPAFGEALVSGFDQALEDMARTGKLSKTYRIRLREEASIEALLEHLGQDSRTIKVQELARERCGDHWILSFRKTFRRSTSKLETLLAGGPVFD